MKRILRKKWRLILYILVALLCVFIIREVWYSRSDVRPELTVSPEVTFTTYEGKNAELSSYEGDVLVVYSWASWCPFCAEGLKVLSQLSDEYAGKVQFVAINRGESLTDAQAFTNTLALSKNVVLLLDVPDAFYKENKGYAMPEIIFITKRGKIALHQRGPLTAVEMRERVEDMFR